MADQKGTGKHPHKSSEDPYPHTKKQGSSGQKSGGTATMEREEGKQETSQNGEDMKEREYRDSKGEVHHHTKTSENKGGKSKRG
jgi:hypothetical protein